MCTKKYNIDYSELSFVTLLLFIWQLPQNLIALIITTVLNKVPDDYHNQQNGMTVMLVPVGTSFSWSLGQFVFVSEEADQRVVRHETGHCVQSLFFGPLYLLLVGLPSLALFIIHFVKSKTGKHTNEELDKWYYSKYPENWADKLGCVNEHDS